MKSFRRWHGAAILLISFAAAQALYAQTTEVPSANPGRPTVTTPATLPPVGYLQFEQGYLGSFTSPDTTAQHGVNEVTRLAVHPRVGLIALLQPYAATESVGTSQFINGFGDVLLGAQIVLFTPTPPKDASATPESASKTAATFKTPVPAVSVSYIRRVDPGNTGDVDLGGYSQSFLLLLSGDVRGFHYDTNYMVNEQSGTVVAPICTIPCTGPLQHTVRRAQFGQTLSVNHAIGNPNLQLSVELYHFTQPLVQLDDHQYSVAHADLFDILVAPSYQVRPNLVLDGGFSHGFTSTSTRWQAFAGFTYLLPHRLWRAHAPA
jgi:hypothetical protein